MGGGFDPLARSARVHTCADPPIEFGPSITLTHRVIGLFTTNMSTYRSIMCLIKDTLILIM